MVPVAFALALLLSAAPLAWAETTPTEALQAVFARANEILSDPATADRPLDRWLGLRKLVNEAFDFRSAAELASGDHWQARTAAEQEEFTWLLADLLERAFVARVAAKADLSGGVKVKYLIEAVDGNTARVTTSMGTKDGRDLLLGYRLVEGGGTWKITDVTMDGVSIMANYRAQLDRVLGSASFPELLTQMRAMVGVTEGPPRAKWPTEVKAPAPAAAPFRAAALPLPPRDVHVATLASPAERTVVTVAVAIADPAPAKAAPRPLTTKAYWLRIMTPATPDEAGRLVSGLRNGRHSVAIERTTANGKPLVVLRVGPFKDAEEAVLELLVLQAKGHDPYLFAERE
jgi:phospholipid transport system substrate-binding protein